MFTRVIVCCGILGGIAACRQPARNAPTASTSLHPCENSLVEIIGVEAPTGFTVSRDEMGIVLTGRFPTTGEGPGAQLHLRHGLSELRHVFVPHLAPEPGFVMGDHAFRSPAIVLGDDKHAVVLIPDLHDVAAGARAGWRTWLDFDHAANTITLTAGDYRTADDVHVMYRAAPVQYQGQDVRLRLHVLASDAPQDRANPYGLAVRYLWTRWGHPRHLDGGSQTAPFDTYAEYITRWAYSADGWGDTVWQEFSIDDRSCGGPAFIVDVAQHPSVPADERCWREARSIWNQAWFSTQRCANGLFRYARRTESADLARRAQLCTNLALAAPQANGLFPSVYSTAEAVRQWYALEKDTPGWDQAHWTNSDRRPPKASAAAYHILDAAFTARLLLEWHELTGDDDALAYVVRFAERLCQLQLPSGAFPGWVEPDGTIVPTLTEGPEAAMGAALLLELYARNTDHAVWRDAARRALHYLETGPVAEGRWEDFETYFSCCRWGYPDLVGKRVVRNGVFKSNTLSMSYCADAFLTACDVLDEERYLQVGRRCLDELSLYQQVWDPPFIPAPCHGGFGVMNADGEWNDARQSLFAPLYLAYGRATGEREYFERGIAALRASFIMLYCPENPAVRRQYELKHPEFGAESYGFMMENIAHGGPAEADGSAIGSFTIYTWGNGAALATAQKIRDLYGDVYIDSARSTAYGIDGCKASVSGDVVRIEDRFGRSSLSVMYDDGTRRDVALRQGSATLPLRPGVLVR